ncbi:fimbrial protein [Budvicia diplopodorum]|uniref:fimbrial protein n=1 Tax=Budvicia diplopodorum TaxID=1119056 RepID=UPI00135C10A2|nr:fimbrial protein [Budvicia diplopodorum]
MSKNKLLINRLGALLGLLISSLLMSNASFAGCSFENGYGTIVGYTTLPSSLSIKRNVAPGTVLYSSGNWVNAGTTRLWCDRGNNNFYYGYSNPMTPAPGFTDVYKTSNPSVGIKFYYANTPNADAWGVTVKYPQVNNDFYVSYNNGEPYIPSLVYKYELIAIDALQSGSISFSGDMLSSTYAPGRVVGRLQVNGTTYVNALNLTCFTTTPNVNINLGTANPAEVGAVGPKNNLENFNIIFDCSRNEGAKITAMLEGRKSSAAATNDILALTGEGTPGVADGVGVQILYNSVPMVLNQPIDLMDAASTTESVALQGRYYQTKVPIYPGTANSTAVLNLTYQ